MFKSVLFLTAVLVVASTGYANNSTDYRLTVLGPARSYHMPRKDGLNEKHLQSFGIGFQTRTKADVEVGVLAYHLAPDSLDGQANMAGGVVYKDFFETDMFRAGLGVFGGYVSKTDYHGPAVSPYIELGYGPLMFMLGYIPPTEDISTSELLGIGGLVFRF